MSTSRAGVPEDALTKAVASSDYALLLPNMCIDVLLLASMFTELLTTPLPTQGARPLPDRAISLPGRSPTRYFRESL
jgi:hypothetical protein